jgi:hypothetical protein
MKITRSILQGALLFAAGVGCTVIAQVGWSPPPTSQEALEKDVNDLLVRVAQLGAYVAVVEKGGVVFNIDPIRCPTPLPPPKMPAFAVDPIAFQQGAAALFTVQQAYLQGVKRPMRNDDKCQIAPE